MKSKKNKLFHIFNLLIAVAFAMAYLFPACILSLPLLIVILFSYANLCLLYTSVLIFILLNRDHGKIIIIRYVAQLIICVFLTVMGFAVRINHTIFFIENLNITFITQKFFYINVSIFILSGCTEVFYQFFDMGNVLKFSEVPYLSLIHIDVYKRQSPIRSKSPTVCMNSVARRLSSPTKCCSVIFTRYSPRTLSVLSKKLSFSLIFSALTGSY